MINKKKIDGYEPWCRNCKKAIGDPKEKNTDAKNQQSVRDHERQGGMHRIYTKSAKMWVAVAKPPKRKIVRTKIANTPTAVLAGLKNKGGQPFRRANDRLKRGECIGCGKRTRTGASHPGCVSDMARGLQSASDASADRHADWNKTTGGIQYDSNGKRIW